MCIAPAYIVLIHSRIPCSHAVMLNRTEGMKIYVCMYVCMGHHIPEEWRSNVCGS